MGVLLTLYNNFLRLRYLLYGRDGRDTRLPTEAALSAPQTREYIDINDYKTALTLNFTGAWSLARQQVQKAQRQQKRFYDRGSRKPTFCVGDRVFVYMPVAKTGKAYKFARLYYGPYRVLEVTASDARVARVDRPQGTPLFVAIDRLRHCPAEISPNESWPELAGAAYSKERPTERDGNPWTRGWWTT